MLCHGFFFLHASICSPLFGLASLSFLCPSLSHTTPPKTNKINVRLILFRLYFYLFVFFFYIKIKIFLSVYVLNCLLIFLFIFK
jgi:hypothetical protein